MLKNSRKYSEKILINKKINTYKESQVEKTKYKLRVRVMIEPSRKRRLEKTVLALKRGYCTDTDNVKYIFFIVCNPVGIKKI
jgi:signal recognition particle receptor subunit beta